LGVTEHEKMAAERFAQQPVADQAVKSFEPFTHVGRSGSQVDARRRANSEHGLCGLQCSEQAMQGGSSKSACISTRRPPASTTASPEFDARGE